MLQKAKQITWQVNYSNLLNGFPSKLEQGIFAIQILVFKNLSHISLFSMKLMKETSI